MYPGYYLLLSADGVPQTKSYATVIFSSCVEATERGKVCDILCGSEWYAYRARR